MFPLRFEIRSNAPTLFDPSTVVSMSFDPPAWVLTFFSSGAETILKYLCSSIFNFVCDNANQSTNKFIHLFSLFIIALTTSEFYLETGEVTSMPYTFTQALGNS